MPFGLTNAPATFQRMINAVLAGLKGMHLQVFIDDVCVATNEWSEHLEILEKVFKLVIKANSSFRSARKYFGLVLVWFGPKGRFWLSVMEQTCFLIHSAKMISLKLFSHSSAKRSLNLKFFAFFNRKESITEEAVLWFWH